MSSQWLGLYHILSRFGAPRAIISDEGRHFANKVFTKLMRKYGIKHLMRLAYYPQLNRQAEISNGEIKKNYGENSKCNKKD